jgi:hypothetical protein
MPGPLLRPRRHPSYLPHEFFVPKAEEVQPYSNVRTLSLA